MADNNKVLIPTSMVGNYPNPRWWDANYAVHFNGDQNPPDSMSREALEDAMAAIVKDQVINLDFSGLKRLAFDQIVLRTSCVNSSDCSKFKLFLIK